MALLIKCHNCNHIDLDLSSDINKIIAMANEYKKVCSDMVLHDSSYSKSTTKHWMNEYNKLLNRHNKVMENKSKHLNKMKQSCYDKLVLQNEYINDLEKNVLMYRKLQKEQYNIRRIEC